MNTIKNAPIYANLLAPNAITKNISEFTIKNLLLSEPNVGKFALPHFFYRYIAGNENLKELRGISRHKLALASSDVGYLMPEAQALLKQTQQYTKAENYLFCQSKLTIACLTKANCIFA